MLVSVVQWHPFSNFFVGGCPTTNGLRQNGFLFFPGGGDWDAHWGYDLDLTHGQMSLGHLPCNACQVFAWERDTYRMFNACLNMFRRILRWLAFHVTCSELYFIFTADGSGQQKLPASRTPSSASFKMDVRWKKWRQSCGMA